MKPGICKKHGVQRFTITSPLLAKADFNDNLGGISITKLRIYSSERWSEYWVDDEYLDHFLPKHSHGEVVLHDRDVVQKKLNDRLLITKITSEMKYVCPICLSEIVKTKLNNFGSSRPDS